MIRFCVPVAFIVAFAIHEVVFVHGVVRVVLLLHVLIVFTILIIEFLKAFSAFEFSPRFVPISMILILFQKVVVIFVFLEFFSDAHLHPLVFKLDRLLVFGGRTCLFLPIGIITLVLEFIACIVDGARSKNESVILFPQGGVAENRIRLSHLFKSLFIFFRFFLTNFPVILLLLKGVRMQFFR